jgi:hypothetical protein
MLGGLLIPVDGFTQILVYSLSMFVQTGEVVCGGRVPLLGRGPVVIGGPTIILRNSGSGFIEVPQAELSVGIAGRSF